MLWRDVLRPIVELLVALLHVLHHFGWPWKQIDLRCFLAFNLMRAGNLDYALAVVTGRSACCNVL
jgi:hypothetical protein